VIFAIITCFVKPSKTYRDVITYNNYQTLSSFTHHLSLDRPMQRESRYQQDEDDIKFDGYEKGQH
jgi:hypothetical protein